MINVQQTVQLRSKNGSKIYFLYICSLLSSIIMSAYDTAMMISNINTSHHHLPPTFLLKYSVMPELFPSFLCFLEHNGATLRDRWVTDTLIMNCPLCN